ncbi:hypothetical protein P3S67_022749 [Capsicum chacoense]
MYVATLRELLEQLTEERNPDGLPRSVCIVLFQLDNLEKMTCCYKSFQTFGFLTICDCFLPDVHTPEEPVAETSSSGTPKAEESVNSTSEGLR